MRIVARASGYRSSESIETFTTLQALLEMPVVRIEEVTTNTLSVSWVAQEGVEGLMYRAELAEEGVEELLSYAAVPASQASSELSSLEAGTRYTLRIVASATGYRSNELEISFATQLASPELMVEDADAEDGSRTTQSVVLTWAEGVKSASTYEIERAAWRWYRRSSVRDGRSFGTEL